MSGVSKITADRNQKILLELVSKPGNDVCADCKARNPRWASHNLGIFICVNCASIHRKIGTHVTKVKSVTMDSWTKEQVEVMRNNGNIRSNAIYNPNENRHPPPVSTMDGERDSEMEQYVRGKYEHKRFISRSVSAAPQIESTTRRSTTSTGLGVPTARNSGRTPSPGVKVPGSVPMTQTRSFSQPLPNSLATPSSSIQPMQSSFQPSQPSYQQQQQQQQPPPPQTQQQQPQGVWADLVSLQAPSSTSSLPLQYQSPSQQMPMMTGMQMQNSFPPQQQSFQQTNQMPFQPNPNSFQQNVSQPAGNSFQSSMNSFQPNNNAFTPNSFEQSSNPFQQQSTGFGQPQYTGYNTNPSMAFNSGQQQSSAFSMQPQFSNQPMVQSPSAQQPNMQSNFLSPIGQMSNPMGMTNFSTPSPQPWMSTTPQMQPSSGQFSMTPSPQPNFMPQNNFAQPQQPQQQQQFGQWALPQNAGFNGMAGQQQQQSWGTM